MPGVTPFRKLAHDMISQMAPLWLKAAGPNFLEKRVPNQFIPPRRGNEAVKNMRRFLEEDELQDKSLTHTQFAFIQELVDDIFIDRYGQSPITGIVHLDGEPLLSTSLHDWRETMEKMGLEYVTTQKDRDLYRIPGLPLPGPTPSLATPYLNRSFLRN